MRPVLMEILGFPVQSYGVSKVLAALVAGVLLSRAFRTAGWDPDRAWNLVLYGTVAGFVGAKIYYVAENVTALSWHHLGGSGFTWYGGLLAGVGTVLVLARKYRLPWKQLAGMTAVPLSVAYGIGRIGCFLAGDGTYGRPTSLPWGMSFPDGVVPTLERVHPTALYEAVMAFAIAAALWGLRTRLTPVVLFGVYAVASGLARYWVETVRVNEPVHAGLTQPQLWSIALMLVGLSLLLSARADSGEPPGGGPVTSTRSRRDDFRAPERAGKAARGGSVRSPRVEIGGAVLAVSRLRRASAAVIASLD